LRPPSQRLLEERSEVIGEGRLAWRLLSGYLLGLSAFGWPLVVAGVLKSIYDLLLLAMFAKVRPSEEVG